TGVRCRRQLRGPLPALPPRRRLAAEQQVQQPRPSPTFRSTERLRAAVCYSALFGRIPPSYLTEPRRDNRASSPLAPRPTKNAGTPVMTGQATSATSRSCWCWLVVAADRERTIAPTANPSAPSAAANATCSAAERDALRSRKRSYPR